MLPDRQDGDVLRGALIGFGAIAQGHLKGYAQVDGLAATSVVDPCDSRRRVARSLGLNAYEGLDEMLAVSVPDFLDVCSPPDSHHHYIDAALGRGIPVLCEKPVFVPCGVGYEVIRDHIRITDTVVYPAHNYKFAPAFDRLRREITSGTIGVVNEVCIRVMRAGHARGVTDWYPDWRRDPAVSYGGVLRDHGTHGVYLATSIAGLVPHSVSCVLGSMASNASWATEDTALLRIRCQGGEKIELSLTWCAEFRDSRYTFVGSAGFASVENDVITLGSGGTAREFPVRSDFNDPAHGAWFAAMFRDFRAAVTSPREHRSRLQALIDESLLASAVIDAGYASASLGGAWQKVDH